MANRVLKKITHDDIKVQDDSVREAWEDVIIKNLPVKGRVRPEIYQSWIKSKKMGLDPYSNEPPLTLSGNKLNRLFRTNKIYRSR